MRSRIHVRRASTCSDDESGRDPRKDLDPIVAPQQGIDQRSSKHTFKVGDHARLEYAIEIIRITQIEIKFTDPVGGQAQTKLVTEPPSALIGPQVNTFIICPQSGIDFAHGHAGAQFTLDELEDGARSLE